MNTAQSAIKRAMPSIQSTVQTTDKTIHQVVEIAHNRGKLLLPGERAKHDKRHKRIMLARISLAVAPFLLFIATFIGRKRHSGE